ncbi:MAG TPA: hypothetical protein VFD60_14570 [Nitrososphaeraceae archaeon]|nr:hypothetical protein [Nitrososphaeraceae archaeon]
MHLLNGLYDAKADNTPVIAITGATYSELMNYSYQYEFCYRLIVSLLFC